MTYKLIGKSKVISKLRRHARLRKKVNGTPERPRLVLTRSNKNIVAQIVDDTVGKTLVSSTSVKQKIAGTKTDVAKAIGSDIAAKATKAGIKQVVFDRGGNKYHGRIAAVAEGAREAGLKF
ncbi:MAG: 50S ribosomal protein L18 [Bifidobacteriaceae bacterium]|jgi:large subunit ribosomal protein L18|nr:50S ribosomal protein L18 [Bifidobacteriaceae bacterium]